MGQQGAGPTVQGTDPALLILGSEEEAEVSSFRAACELVLGRLQGWLATSTPLAAISSNDSM